jgi:hypothetical protein
MDARPTIVRVFCLARLESSLWFRDFLLMFEPEVFFAFLKIPEFGEAPRIGHVVLSDLVRS